MIERVIETVDVGTDEQLTLSCVAQARLFVGAEPVRSVCPIGDGLVALVTTRRTVHIGAADYWRLLQGDAPPSAREAGHLAAQLAHVRSHARGLIDLLERESLIDCYWYPSICKAVPELEAALREQATEELAEVEG